MMKRQPTQWLRKGFGDVVTTAKPVEIPLAELHDMPNEDYATQDAAGDRDGC
ncbi:hypothetical protein KIH77_03125 [Bifidobacterium sp. 82T24]|uniref:hypothetical protein n=1 Tax=Bifidobacterium pluvialisilvae TaxID=2834436 RepID=UPI001C58AA9E|nr:hypothetical protein [Bifidobacterium pluvialisilvae]MBW3087728.1 hypothetical protein [Bifidobacterium pluvialisilvae]